MFPIPARTLVLLAGVAGVLLAIHLVLKAEREKGRAQCEAAYAAASAKAAAEQRSRFIADTYRNQEAANAYRQKLEAGRPARAAADRHVAGVRDSAAALGDRAASASPSASGVDATTARLAGLLAEGAGLVEEGRQRVEGLAAQVSALQATSCMGQK